MAINVGKLLPPSKSSNALSKDIIKKMASPADNFSAGNSTLASAKNRPSQILIIRTQVIRIENLVKRKYVEDIKKQKEENKLKEQYDRRKREEKLEEKPKEKEKLPNTVKLPKIGFLDGIKNFIVNLILGFVAFRLIQHLPKIASFLKVLAPAVDFFIDFSGKLLDGLVTFIDWGYKAYDFTRKQLTSFGGENFVKVFDTFNGAVGKVIEAAITTAIVLGSQGDDGVLDIGGDIIKDRLLQRGAQQAATTTAGQVGGEVAGVGAGAAAGIVAGAGLLASAIGEGAFQLKKLGRSQEEKQRKAFEREKNPLLKGILWLGYQQGRFGNFMLGNIGVLLDIVGAPFRYAIELIRYPFLSAKDKEKQKTNLGKLDARIRDQFRENLNNITSVFGVQLKEGSFGSLYGNKAVGDMYGNKMAGGGQPTTRGGKVVGGKVSRKYKKPITRQLQTQTPKLNSGKDIGGEKNIEKVFPNPKNKDTVSPLGYIEKSYDTTSKIPFFGPLFAIATKVILGEKPSSLDYKNVGIGINSWMNTTFSNEVLRTGGAFASGGEVNAEMFMRGDDLSNIIAKSVEESIASRIDDSINDLMKQLLLKGFGGVEEKTPAATSGQQGVEGAEDFSGSTGAEKTMHFLISQGLTGAQAAGIAGNLQQESGFNPNPSGNPTHHGIAQWDNQVRWPRVSAYIRSVGRDPNTLEGQLVGLKWEAEQRGDWREIKKASSARDASAIWLERFERSGEKPGMPGFENRMRYANDLLAKYGNYVPTTGGSVQLGKGYGAEGSKIAGELGRYIYRVLKSPQQFQAVTEHPEFGGVHNSAHAQTSFHKEGRAIDIGAYSWEQGPILKAIADFNRMKGVKPVELLKAGDPGHNDHVHVAYAKGGLVDGVTYAMLGERGREFVLDADTTEALRGSLPGFLEALNSATNVSSALKVIQSYMSYEDGYPQEIIIEDNPLQDLNMSAPPQQTPSSTIQIHGNHDPFEILDRLPG